MVAGSLKSIPAQSHSAPTFARRPGPRSPWHVACRSTLRTRAERSPHVARRSTHAGSWILLLARPSALAGCNDDDRSPRVDPDVPPAAPRGVYSVTGDGIVTSTGSRNTERDVAGYRIYQAPCANGPACPYNPIGTHRRTQLRITGLANGVTRFYAVAAFDLAGNESDLSLRDGVRHAAPGRASGSCSPITSTARPAAAGTSPPSPRVPGTIPTTDIFFGYNGSISQMFVPDFSTDIQDAGYASDLDAVDFAPSGGWSPTGSVELIPGHCYVVWTRDNHYAKFRVTSVIPATPTVAGAWSS